MKTEKLESIISIVSSKVSELQKDVIFSELIYELDKYGEVCIVGGAIRDWIFGFPPKDIDLAVDTENESGLYEYLSNIKNNERNSFGGYRIYDEKFDIWSLAKTYAFTTDEFKSLNIQPDFIGLAKTVFFNTDPIYSLTKNHIYGDEFIKMLNTKTLSIVYEPNKSPINCIAKGLLHIKKYKLSVGKDFKDYVIRNCEDGITWNEIEERLINMTKNTEISAIDLYKIFKSII